MSPFRNSLPFTSVLAHTAHLTSQNAEHLSTQAGSHWIHTCQHIANKRALGKGDIYVTARNNQLFLRSWQARGIHSIMLPSAFEAIYRTLARASKGL